MSNSITPGEVAVEDSSAAFSAACKKYVVENLIKSTSVAILFLGGLMLLVFFLHIGYMPDVNLESIASVLYAVAFLGLFIVVCAMFMMVFPGLLLAEAKKVTKGVHVGHLFCISFGASLIWVFWLFHMFQIYVIESNVVIFGVPAVIAILAALAGVIISRKFFKESTDDAEHGRYSPRENPVLIGVWSLIVTAAVVGLVALALGFVGVIGLNGDIRYSSGGDAYFRLVLLLVVISLSTVAIGGSKSSEVAKIALMLSLVLLFVMFVATGTASSIPMMAMRLLGLGEISAAQISVTGKTCREIIQTQGQRVCRDDVADDAVTVICPVILRSRIGSQAVLDFAPIGFSDKAKPFWMIKRGAAEGKSGAMFIRRVILDRDKLLSWRPLSSLGERDEVSVGNSTFPRVGTWMDLDNPEVLKADEDIQASYRKLLSDECGIQSAPIFPESVQKSS